MVLNSEVRQLVLNLIEYFDTEKANGGPLISIDKVHERVANALKIGINTVSRIKQHTLKNPQEHVSTPNKKRKRKSWKSTNIGEGVKSAIRDVIYDMYANHEHITVTSLNQKLQQKQIAQISTFSLSKILQELGFTYKKDDNRRALCEQTSITLRRVQFVQNYIHNMHSEIPHQVVFLDETWIFAKGGCRKSWQDNSVKSVKRSSGPGKRFVIVHAGTSEGFIPEACMIFPATSKSADYHDNMNKERFQKWLEEQLLPNLEQPSLIVMDNAPYHSHLINKQPNSNWNKEDVIKWLTKNNITFPKNAFKTELLALSKKTQKARCVFY